VLEMRAAEEPLKPDVDVAGLRARVLERVEELEERENLLSEILPEMESRGYETVGEGSKSEGRECKEDTGRTERF
jgi:hypothetical protein